MRMARNRPSQRLPHHTFNRIHSIAYIVIEHAVNIIPIDDFTCRRSDKAITSEISDGNSFARYLSHWGMTVVEIHPLQNLIEEGNHP